MILNPNKILLLYECNKVVIGANSALIIDLQRSMYISIPVELGLILQNLGSSSMADIIGNYKDDAEILKSNLEVLIKNDILFLTDYPDQFPKLNMEWDSYSDITNCIIDVGEYLYDNLTRIIKNLEEVSCEAIQLRFFKKTTLADLTTILTAFQECRLISVELICEQTEPLNSYISLTDKFPRIFSILLFNCESEEGLLYSSKTRMGHIYGIKDSKMSEKSCGQIGRSLFSININTFTESVNHNSCLNRKISIDTMGNIKNCPSMHKSYGNIVQSSFANVLAKSDFKELWKVGKDKIYVCKDCEFRHICIDCRAYVEDPNDILSKPLKCGYNPYTGEWSDWTANPLKEKAIKIYDFES